MRFQFCSMSEDSGVGISFKGSSVPVCEELLNQRYCGSSQQNIPDKMLRVDAYSYKPESKFNVHYFG